MDLQLGHDFEFRRAPQSLAQDVGLDLELVFVVGVLIVTAPAAGEISASWLNAVGGRFDDRFRVRSREAGFLPDDSGFDLFLSQNERNECRLAAAVFVSGQSG